MVGRLGFGATFRGVAATSKLAFWLGFAALFVYGEILHGNNADIPSWRVVFSVLGWTIFSSCDRHFQNWRVVLAYPLILYLVFLLLLWCMETPLRRRALGVLMAVLAVVGRWSALRREAGHTVLGRLPAFARWACGSAVRLSNVQPSHRILYRTGGLAFCG